MNLNVVTLYHRRQLRRMILEDDAQCRLFLCLAAACRILRGIGRGWNFNWLPESHGCSGGGGGGGAPTELTEPLAPGTCVAPPTQPAALLADWPMLGPWCCAIGWLPRRDCSYRLTSVYDGIRMTAKLVPEFIDPRFRENKLKTLVFSHRKRAYWACFRENCVYNFGHWSYWRINMKFNRAYCTMHYVCTGEFIVTFVKHSCIPLLYSFANFKLMFDNKAVSEFIELGVLLMYSYQRVSRLEKLCSNMMPYSKSKIIFYKVLAGDSIFCCVWNGFW